MGQSKNNNISFSTLILYFYTWRRIKFNREITKLRKLPVARLGTSMPVAAKTLCICCSTMDKLAAGLGQSVPFIDTGFQTPLVTSAVK